MIPRNTKLKREGHLTLQTIPSISGTWMAKNDPQNEHTIMAWKLIIVHIFKERMKEKPSYCMDP